MEHDGRVARVELPNRELDAEADQVFATIEPLIAGLQATFGRKCEIVLHDYRRQEHSVIAVAGDVTNRQVGSPMSQIGLSILRQGDDATDQLNYVTRLPDGRQIKASTVLLRTRSGHVIGALCVNVDITELKMFGRVIAEFVGDSEVAEADRTTFGTDIDTVIQAAVAEVEDTLGRPLARLSTAEWTEVFRQLDRRGVFQLKRGVPIVAQQLGLSRASVYNYIARIRDQDDKRA